MPLTERQQKIIGVFLESPEETRSVADFADFGLERTTVFRDIKKLVQAGLLQPEGKAYRVNTDSPLFQTTTVITFSFFIPNFDGLYVTSMQRTTKSHVSPPTACKGNLIHSGSGIEPSMVR